MNPCESRSASDPALVPTVHVVDDEEPVRTSLARLLRAAGIPVRTYASGEEYIASCKSGVAGCLLIDLYLPGCTGVETQERLAASGCALPVIFLTGSDDAAAHALAIMNDAVGVLTKPVVKQTLLGAIRAAFARERQSAPWAG